MPGVSWNTISTPSIVRDSIVWAIESVGAISENVPRDRFLPNPASTWPRGPGASNGPNWNCARRLIALPAMMFSATACSMNPCGA